MSDISHGCVVKLFYNNTHAIVLFGELNNAVNNQAIYTTLLQQQLFKSKLN